MKWCSRLLSFYQIPSDKDFCRLLIKEDTAPVLTVHHALSQWIPWAVSCSLGVVCLVLEFVTEQRALRSQFQCLKEIKLKMDYICKLLLEVSILRK